MKSEDDTYEEEGTDSEFSESEATQDATQLMEDIKIQENEQYGTLDNVFFHILPPLHPNSVAKVLVYLPLQTPLYFKGKIKIIRVISGTLECLGNVMTPESVSGYGQSVFSPKGYSLLSLSAVLKQNEYSNNAEEKNLKLRKQIKNELKDLGVKKEVFREIYQKDEAKGCFFEIAKLEGPGWVKSLEKYLPHSASNIHSFGSSRKGRPGTIALFGRDYTPPTHQSSLQNRLEAIEHLLNISLYDSYPNVQNNKVPRLFRSSPEWDATIGSIFDALKSDNRNPRLVVAGGKGVGKSTFMRFITNRLLNRAELKTASDFSSNYAKSYIPLDSDFSSASVLYIDLDPGQAEFTIPGCLSATKVVRPIMGPNFCHLDRAKVYCEYFGDVNVSNMPRSYDECVGRILRYCENNSEFKKIPWLINTMGFTNGLGAKMMSHVLQIFHPGTVVELRSRFVKKNYKTNLENYVKQLKRSSGNECEFFQISAIPESLDAKDMRAKSLWGIPEPKKLRDISMLSYFGQCNPDAGNENIGKNMILAAVPYVVSWDNVAVQVLHANVSTCSIPKLLNMSLVGLGRIENENHHKISLNPGAIEFVPGSATGNPKEIEVPTEDAETEKVGLKPPKLLSQKVISMNIGFGFVRGVDTEKRLFYVVTPVPPEEMEFVNCLTLGALTLPTGIIGSQAAQLMQSSNRKFPKKETKKKAYRAAKENKSTGNHIPYLVTNLKSNQNTNHGLCATPFSAPWQRYSKPKFQKDAEETNF